MSSVRHAHRGWALPAGSLLLGVRTRRRGTLARQGVRKPLARCDSEFHEYLAEVPFDGAGADEQLSSDLGVGASDPGEPRDVLLLRGQVVVVVDVPLADLLTGG